MTKRWKSLLWMTASIGSALLVLFGGLLTMTVPSVAQTVRAALVRDVDNGALDPVRIDILALVGPSEGSKVLQSITVPAGKRLVIENASVWTRTFGTDRITGIWLSVGFAHYIFLDHAPSEVKPTTSIGNVAAYNQAVKAYFNAGEQLRLEVLADGSTSSKSVQVYLQGHYVTLP